MTKQKPTAPAREADRYQALSVEYVRALAESLMWQEEAAAIGDFLMLCRALAYSPERENIYCAIEFGVTPYLRAANDVVDHLIGARLEAAGEGGVR